MRTYPRNSRALERRFPTVYRRFFSTHQKIASAPYTFYWAGEFSGLYNEGLTISQQLPFRIYVGLQVSNKPGFSLEPNYLGYDTTQNAFTERLLDAHFCAKLEHYLTEHYPNQNAHIDLLCEVPFGFGMGSNAALGSALSLLLEAKNTAQAALAIAAAIQHGVSSGSSVSTTLSEYPLPLFHTKETTQSLSTLSALPPSPLACDVALIATGIPNYGENAIRASEVALASLKERSTTIKTLLNLPGDDLTSRYLAGLNATTEIMMLSLLQLTKEGGNSGAIEQLTTATNQFHSLLETIHPFQTVATHFRNHFLYLSSQHDANPSVGVKVSGYGAGGMLLLVMPEGRYRTTLATTLDELNQQKPGKYALEFASWHDGSNTLQAGLEQDITHEKMHVHFRGTLTEVTLIHNLLKENHTITTDSLPSYLERNYADISIDLTTNRITVAGKALTSAHLPSQKATSQLLKLLLISKTHSATSDEITGTYGLNRYDLQGKIILPLRKIVQELLGHDLILNLHGSSSEFTVSLDPAGLSFVLAEAQV